MKLLKDLKIIVLIVLFLLLIPPSIVSSSSHPSSQEDISIETVEEPFFRNVTDISHSDGGMVYVGTDVNGLAKYDIEDESFEVLNTTSDFPTDKIDYVKWSSKNEELYFSNFDPEPYYKNESIIPYAYSFSQDNDITPIGNRGEGASKLSSIDIYGNNLYIDGHKILVDFINRNTSNNQLYSLYFHIPIPNHYHAEISDQIMVGNGYIYNIYEVKFGGLTEYSYISKYPLVNVSQDGDGEVTDYEKLGWEYEQIYDIDFNNYNNNLYVGTSEGIYFIDSTSLQRITIINETDGLRSNKILHITHNNENIFAVSEKGISIINLKTNDILNIDVSDGLLSKKINCIDWNENRSELYVGHDNGISILTIEDNTDLPTITTRQVTQAAVGKEITINTTVTDNSNLSSVKLFYRTKGQTNFTTVQMKASGEDYTAEIPAVDGPGTIEYYIQATDIYGNENQTDVHEVEVEEPVDDGLSPERRTVGLSIAFLVILITVGVLIYFAVMKDKR